MEVGYCWQFNPNAPAATVAQNPWLWCIEGRYDFPRERGSIETIPGGVGIIQINNNVDPFLFGPKLGALFANNRLFLYGAGGLAVGKVALSANATTVLNGNEGSGAGSKTKAGWFVGLGGEYLLDRHWSVKIEYDYVNFGGGGVSATLNPTCLRGCTLTPAVVSVGRVHDNVISVGINYHFGTR